MDETEKTPNAHPDAATHKNPWNEGAVRSEEATPIKIPTPATQVPVSNLNPWHEVAKSGEAEQPPVPKNPWESSPKIPGMVPPPPSITRKPTQSTHPRKSKSSPKSMKHKTYHNGEGGGSGGGGGGRGNHNNGHRHAHKSGYNHHHHNDDHHDTIHHGGHQPTRQRRRSFSKDDTVFLEEDTDQYPPQTEWGSSHGHGQGHGGFGSGDFNQMRDMRYGYDDPLNYVDFSAYTDGFPPGLLPEGGASFLGSDSGMLSSVQGGGDTGGGPGGGGFVGESEVEQEREQRRFSQVYAIALMEEERRRRVQVLADMQQRDDNERALRREWAISVMEEEHRSIMRDMFVNNISSTDWFQEMVTPVINDFEIVCPNHIVGCYEICNRKNIEAHLEVCPYAREATQEDGTEVALMIDEAEIVCPNAVLGCKFTFRRDALHAHLKVCKHRGQSQDEANIEREEWRERVIQAAEKERERRILLMKQAQWQMKILKSVKTFHEGGGGGSPDRDRDDDTTAEKGSTSSGKSSARGSGAKTPPAPARLQHVPRSPNARAAHFNARAAAEVSPPPSPGPYSSKSMNILLSPSTPPQRSGKQFASRAGPSPAQVNNWATRLFTSSTTGAGSNRGGGVDESDLTVFHQSKDPLEDYPALPRRTASPPPPPPPPTPAFTASSAKNNTDTADTLKGSEGGGNEHRAKRPQPVLVATKVWDGKRPGNGLQEENVVRDALKQLQRGSNLQRCWQDQTEFLQGILHCEIEDHTKESLENFEGRAGARNALLSRFEALVRVVWPDAVVKPYGSFSTKLHLCKVSDIDILVCRRKTGREVSMSVPMAHAKEGGRSSHQTTTRRMIHTPKMEVQELAQHLRRAMMSTTFSESPGGDGGRPEGANKSWIQEIKVLDHLTIPLIKILVEVEGHGEGGSGTLVGGGEGGAPLWKESVWLDVSVENQSHSGLASATMVKDLSKEFPQLVPLTLILKRFLASRNLNDPYTGGLSSYALFLMVTFVLLRQRRIDQQTAFILNTNSDRGGLESGTSSCSSSVNGDDEAGEDTCSYCTKESSQGGRMCAQCRQLQVLQKNQARSAPTSPGGHRRRPNSGDWSHIEVRERKRPSSEDARIAREELDQYDNELERCRMQMQKQATCQRGKSAERDRREQLAHQESINATLRAIRSGGHKLGRTFEQQEEHGRGVASNIIHPKTNLNLTVQEDDSSIDLGEGGGRLSLDSLDSIPPIEPPPDVPMDVTGPSLGKLLMDFLQYFGEDFSLEHDGISVRNGGFRFSSTTYLRQRNWDHVSSMIKSKSKPPSSRSNENDTLDEAATGRQQRAKSLDGEEVLYPPGEGPPKPLPQLLPWQQQLVIEDPLMATNNVGKSCFRIATVLRAFSEALQTLHKMILRVGKDGRLSDGRFIMNTRVLEEICGPSMDME
jgi:DNA polymerase sigma